MDCASYHRPGCVIRGGGAMNGNRCGAMGAGARAGNYNIAGCYFRYYSSYGCATIRASAKTRRRFQYEGATCFTNFPSQSTSGSFTEQWPFVCRFLPQEPSSECLGGLQTVDGGLLRFTAHASRLAFNPRLTNRTKNTRTSGGWRDVCAGQ